MTDNNRSFKRLPPPPPPNPFDFDDEESEHDYTIPHTSEQADSSDISPERLFNPIIQGPEELTDHVSNSSNSNAFLQVPQNAIIAPASPKQGNNNILDPFNTVNYDNDSDSYVCEDDSASYLAKTNSKITSTNIFENQLERPESSSNNNNDYYYNSDISYANSPNKANVLNPPENYYYDYSPSDSYQNLASTTQHDGTHTPVFQTFERDFDEPELDNNDMFEQTTGGENKVEDIQQANIATKCDNKVELFDDKYYSFDYPIPKQLMNKIPFEGAKKLTEFTHLRYHAITADCKDYKLDDPVSSDYIENYPLRQNLYPIKRETELMIVCTMYNEDEVLLGRTLKGVFKNIKYMYNLSDESNSHPFGKDAWKKIVVVIVSDGRSKIHERSKALLTLLGCFQEGIIQEKVNDKDVNAHLFEYTTTFGIGKFDYHRSDRSYTVPLVTEQTVPVQLMFLLKEQNKQKINSHRWALNFLCPNLRPKVVCLLDVGTEPGPNSIFKLWEAFKDPKVGGACGEIRAMLGNHASPNDETSIMHKIGRYVYAKLSDFKTCLINPLIAAQNFEYKISNILDKPMESAFGFVSVLPGAFSAYRYEALQGAPLEAYFHGEDMKSNTDKPAGVLESNMYLAEDRILCFELVSKTAHSYLLRYVHNSYAVTDVPSQINEFMNQRRRWLNGSFFAALYSIIHFYRILNSTHSFIRKCFLVIEIIYQMINIALSWFSLSIYFLVFRILTLDVITTSIGEHVGNILAVVFLWIYIAALTLSFIISFGNKPNDAKFFYLIAFALFAIVVIYMTFCVVCLTVDSIIAIHDEIANGSSISIAIQYLKNKKFRDLTVSLSSTYVLYILGSVLFFDTFHLFACTLQYLLLSPAYINVLSVFAFCNIHDISWGTKGSLQAPVTVKREANLSTTKESTNLLLSENLEDPDELYREAQLCIENPVDKEKSDFEKRKQNLKLSEKNYALGRTYTVLIWLILNFALIVVVLRTGGLEDYVEFKDNSSATSSSATTSSNIEKRDYLHSSNVANTFMTVILWTVAGLALFRFVGCLVYRIGFFISRRKNYKNVVY